MTVAKYALFLYEDHEAAGGINDMVLRYDTMEACTALAEASDHKQNAQIVDCTTMLLVKTGEWEYEPSPLTGGPITWRYVWKDAP